MSSFKEWQNFKLSIRFKLIS